MIRISGNSKNQDIGRFSVFMQIRGQGANRALEMGPLWDFNNNLRR